MSLQAISAIHHALGEPEEPLSAEDAQAASEGTNQEMSAFSFWNAVNQHQLNDSALLTWKFCHLFHSVLRDGHANVARDSKFFLSNVDSLYEHWKHFESTNYATCSEMYAKVLADRIRFHLKFPSISGKLDGLRDANDFELISAMFDQMENLLELQRSVFNTVDHLGLSSIAPQAQCLTAPLVFLILETSKLYCHLVRMLFALHSQKHTDEGHMSRFRDIFKCTCEFYERCCETEYLKSRISIPSLSIPPNFEEPIDSYRVPEARLLQ